MRYIIEESIDPKDVNRTIFADKVSPRIGEIIFLKDGRTFKVVDVEFHETPLRGVVVNGVLHRLS